MSKLTIISHTEHYKNINGELVGLGSTVTEINHLIDIFDEIVHVAMLHEGIAPPSALPYNSSKIKFVALPALGGPTFKDKFSIVFKAPLVLKIVKKALKNTDYFQFRAPTGIGVFVIPYLIFFSKQKGWFKYAGNWQQKNAPIAYRLQRWLLKNQKRKVTINGFWKQQPSQCLTFENPCLTLAEINKGLSIIENKSFKNIKINICFVGRLEKEKGIDLLIKALKNLPLGQKNKIGDIHIVGDGKEKGCYEKQVLNSDLNFIFHGFLSRKDVHDIYISSHTIILPSASEGFPKVIAEAMNFGCLPIVTNISSIGHYVVDELNGFLVFPITLENLSLEINKSLNLTDYQYSKMITISKKELMKFSYSYYNKRIEQDILFIN